MPKTPRTPKKTLKKQETSKSAQSKTRKLKSPQYKSFRLSKRIKQPKPPLTGAFRLFWRSLNVLWRGKGVFLGILVVYFVVSLIFVRAFSVSVGGSALKTDLLEIFQGNSAQLNSNVTIFTLLLGTTGSAGNEVGGVYQVFLLIIISLAVIWTLRQKLAQPKHAVRIRDGFYNGMHPFVPFLLVLLVIGLQLFPLVIASFLWDLVFSYGLAATVLEQVLWVALLSCFGLLSLYMVSSSLFALYIVTLPNVTPMQALRSARDLVRFRRWSVMRKVLFLPVMLIILAAIIVIPLIFISPPIAEWTFYVLSLLALVVAHSYGYNLYRELL